MRLLHIEDIFMGRSHVSSGQRSEIGPCFAPYLRLISQSAAGCGDPSCFPLTITQ